MSRAVAGADPFDLLRRVAVGRALSAAAGSGILDAMGAAPRTLDELAARHGLRPEVLRPLLELLASDGWLRRGERGWSLHPDLAPAPHAAPQRYGTYIRMFEGLEGTLTGGRPVPSDYENTVGALGAMFEPLAEELAASLDGSPGRVLELGAGSGVFGLALARAFDLEELVLYDLPEVVRSSRERAARVADERGVDIRAVGGDFLTDALPGGFDSVLICNVMRILPPDDARRLVERTRGSLREGGRIIILDVFGPDRPAVRERRRVYALHLAMRHPGAGPYDERRLRGWLTGAGYGTPCRLDLRHGPLGEHALIARR